MDDICYLNVADLRAAFTSGTLSPLEVLDAQIERYEQVNGSVNAVTDTHFDEARASARDAEGRYRRGEPRPLEGITCALKDEDGLAGWRMTAGSMVLAENTLTRNTPVVDHLQRAGAIFHLQTTVPEFYFIGHTWSKLWGVTRNPWNLRYTVGGSSGGSGAALAAGMCTLATGSDMGGSIRLPASFNGLYGFKPPHGRVPLVPGGEIMPQGTSGPMARTFADLAVMATAMTGPHPDQMTALRPAMAYPLDHPSVDGMRIAYSSDQGWATIDPVIRSNTEEALNRLRRAGAVVEEVDLAFDGAAMQREALKSLLSSAMGSMLIAINEAAPAELLTGYARYFADMVSDSAGPVQLAQGQEYAAAMHALYDALFEGGFDVLISPTTTTCDLDADFDFLTDTVTVNGMSVDPLTGWMLTPAFNMMYTIPVLSVPTGRASNGIPTGMQIAARAFDDLTAFRVAAAHSAVTEPLFIPGQMPEYVDDRPTPTDVPGSR